MQGFFHPLVNGAGPGFPEAFPRFDRRARGSGGLRVANALKFSD